MKNPYEILANFCGTMSCNCSCFVYDECPIKGDDSCCPDAKQEVWQKFLNEKSLNAPLLLSRFCHDLYDGMGKCYQCGDNLCPFLKKELGPECFKITSKHWEDFLSYTNKVEIEMKNHNYLFSIDGKIFLKCETDWTKLPNLEETASTNRSFSVIDLDGMCYTTPGENGYVWAKIRSYNEE